MGPAKYTAGCNDTKELKINMTNKNIISLANTSAEATIINFEGLIALREQGSTGIYHVKSLTSICDMAVMLWATKYKIFSITID